MDFFFFLAKEYFRGGMIGAAFGLGTARNTLGSAWYIPLVALIYYTLDGDRTREGSLMITALPPKRPVLYPY